MGNQVSRNKKAAKKRFKLDFKKVKHLIQEAKQSEEEMDFQEAASIYMQALKIVYAYMDEESLPEDIYEDISKLVVDMIKKREHLLEHKKMYDIAKKSFSHDNKKLKEEDGKLSEPDSSDEENDIKLVVQEMAAEYHKLENINQEKRLQEQIEKQRFRLQCQILNKRADDEDDAESERLYAEC